MENIKTEWDLEKHFFSSLDDERIQQTIDSEIEKIDIFIEGYSGDKMKYNCSIHQLNDEEFIEFLNEKSELFKGLTKVYHYYSYLTTLDTQNQDALKAQSLLINVWNQQAKKLTFITQEYKKIGYDKLIERSENPIFSEVKNALVNSANTLKYSLDEDQEKNLIEVDAVIDIFTDIYSELTNSFTFEIDGEEKTKSQVYAMRLSQDEDVRRKANEALYGKYMEHQIVLGGIYKSVCKDNVAGIKVRGIEGVMKTRNISEEMDDEVVDNLLSKVKENYPIFHEFLALKAKFLGKDKLEFHDVLAPIPNEKDSKISFEEGLKLYLDKIKTFDEEFYNYSKEMFEDGRVTVFPSKNKRGGAYASYTKDSKSFVMLNHEENFDSVMTLAHELGHAIHGNLEQCQHKMVYSSPLSLAETASIFNETLVFGDLLEFVSEEEKNYYLMKKLDDCFSTMFRQVMYVDFERECHTRFLNGEELTYEDFNEIWMEKCREAYGEGVNLPENSKAGWSVIPHIFETPFYCYAYSFGNILSFNLYNMFNQSKEEGWDKQFIEDYKNILKSGGSKRPKDLLAEYNIDITSDEFYNNAFNVIKGYISTVSESLHTV